jgi:hypothetical protein
MMVTIRDMISLIPNKLGTVPVPNLGFMYKEEEI